MNKLETAIRTRFDEQEWAAGVICHNDYYPCAPCITSGNSSYVMLGNNIYKGFGGAHDLHAPVRNKYITNRFKSIISESKTTV